MGVIIEGLHISVLLSIILEKINDKGIHNSYVNIFNIPYGILLNDLLNCI